MSRLRPVLGLVAGVLLLLSAAAHSFLGWPAMRTALRAASAPADLVTGLGVGWNFGGVAILVFGLLALRTFLARWRGRPEPLWPMRLVGAVYLAFGIVALAIARDPFFTVFVVPGALLLAAAGVRDA